jgi:hypothetical protein
MPTSGRLRLLEVAEQLAYKLALAGVTEIPRTAKEAAEDGWFAPVAKWNPLGLTIAVWFDKWLGPRARPCLPAAL